MQRRVTRRSLMPAVLFILVTALSARAQQSSKPATTDVRLSGGQFLIEGHPWIIKGIHYEPWRPGTGPNKGYPYPPLDGIARDFALIHAAHANTVLLVDAPAEVLDIAEQNGLKVIYSFALPWWSVGDAQHHADVRNAVTQRVEALRRKPALLAWLVGNEAPADVLQAHGDNTVVEGLRDLYRSVKALDAEHPISYGDWPISKHLDLTFFDFMSFNLYPLWPPDVVAMGYGTYIERVLKPLANGRPLLISEFGVNTIEGGAEGQGRLLRDSWRSLRGAGAAGGVVFEFADEWWKNYNNPIRPGNYWTRQPAPDDELQLDDDPEEAYGIVDAERKPKLAYQVVSEMFADDSSRDTTRRVPAGIPLGLVAFAASAYVWSRRSRPRRNG
jgi:hypothetical protein